MQSADCCRTVREHPNAFYVRLSRLPAQVERGANVIDQQHPTVPRISIVASERRPNAVQHAQRHFPAYAPDKVPNVAGRRNASMNVPTSRIVDALHFAHRLVQRFTTLPMTKNGAPARH
jgi:hypothetical protein